MKKITKYEIVVGGSIDLVKTVNDMIQEGWQPLGCPILSPLGQPYQTMVKYEKQYKPDLGPG